MINTEDHKGISPRLSVIMPLHNEAGVIAASLEHLLAQTSAAPFRLIVIANGCRDKTVSIVRTYEEAAASRAIELIVIELSLANKANALNVGDRLAFRGHRIYLDGDVLLSPTALSSIAATLDAGVIKLCAPRIRTAAATSLFTRSYARAWRNTPAVQSDVIGCGVYATSQEGRTRWGEFPDIISDDKYVRLHFDRKERRVLQDCAFQVQMPEGLRELVVIRGRWCRGNNDLRRLFPEIALREPSRIRRTAAALLKRPGLWLDAGIFCIIFLLGEFAALARRNRGVSVWERADRARSVLSRSGSSI